MNIKRAKQEIKDTVAAYLAKDEFGAYEIPSIRQRPMLLIGPPGIGKTQIMEQVAQECRIGLVAYTITHHTRQSAVGLPFIEHKMYGGKEYAVTEYTMSEIVASVYDRIEKSGLPEGILFIDEINCVSETLAPTMLQFLQGKAFGNHKIPEGWIIVAAGNPPEYNKSVREFDIVTMDRIRRIDVEPDLPVWKEYAKTAGVHPSILSYLNVRPQNFCQIETTVDGKRFVTPRGWEDLSELIWIYEKQERKMDRELVGEYIQFPKIAKDFANYLELYYKYQKTYHVEDILSGTWQALTVSELRAAPFDEKLSVMGLLLSRLSESARNTRRQDAFVTALHQDLLACREAVESGSGAAAVLEELSRQKREELRRAKEAGQLDKEKRDLGQREAQMLEDYRARLRREEITVPAEEMDALREWFAAEVEQRRAQGAQTGEQFDNTFRFLEKALEQSQELVIFVTEVTAGYDTSWFVENFGCEAYFRHNRELLFDDTRHRIREEIAAAKAAQKEEQPHE